MEQLICWAKTPTDVTQIYYFIFELRSSMWFQDLRHLLLPVAEVMASTISTGPKCVVLKCQRCAAIHRILCHGMGFTLQMQLTAPSLSAYWMDPTLILHSLKHAQTFSRMQLSHNSMLFHRPLSSLLRCSSPCLQANKLLFPPKLNILPKRQMS